MPSLPTSLIVAGLVIAWLVVLVPMVAKRRERVPESDESAAGFRVLRRASASLRRRPVLSRTAMALDNDRARDARGMGDGPDDLEWGEVDDVDGSAGALELGWDESGRATARVARGVGEKSDGRGERMPQEFESEGSRVVGLDGEPVDDDADAFGEFEDAAVTEHRAAMPVIDRPESSGGAARGAEPLARERDLRRAWRGDGQEVRHPAAARDAADDWAAEHPRAAREPDRVAPAAGRAPASRWQVAPIAAEDRPYAPDDRHRETWDSEAEFRPVPLRTGRGGFDPRAAEQAKTYRYRQRRRIALALLALAVLGAGGGLLGMTLGWAATVTATVLLALYLAYLRRQVRIEEAIRLRRAARLRRARQIRPVYRASVAEQVRAHRTGRTPLAMDDEDAMDDYRVVSHARPTVPPSYYQPGVPVDLDDDDPAFADLEYYRPASYRRAVGE